MEEKQEKKEYEISYITRSEKGQDVVLALCTKYEGIVNRSEAFRKITLAYPIQKETSGFFGVSYVLLDPSHVRDIEHEAKLEGEVLRILVIAEPITVSRQGEGVMEGSAGQRPETRESESKPSGRAATNEELEKKLEEILG